MSITVRLDAGIKSLARTGRQKAISITGRRHKILSSAEPTRTMGPMKESKNPPPPNPTMLSDRGGGGPEWSRRSTSGAPLPSRAIQGVKAIPLYPAKA
ncbi:hypothetical protein AVEN_64492-1 [Araneus ventricosus]|uniref:Uncharacterized protein n=1 Tax=Araneus ventricosus TaxID=182803 RepID=A0A4Y2IP98_ARAVE|nr:hypothetical protein AVEN_64492-1 [Araneus ventricosus]